MNCLSIVNLWSGCIGGATYIEQHRMPAEPPCCVDRAIWNTHTHTENKHQYRFFFFLNVEMNIKPSSRVHLIGRIKQKTSSGTILPWQRTVISILGAFVSLPKKLLCVCSYTNECFLYLCAFLGSINTEHWKAVMQSYYENITAGVGVQYYHILILFVYKNKDILTFQSICPALSVENIGT